MTDWLAFVLGVLWGLCSYAAIRWACARPRAPLSLVPNEDDDQSEDV